MSSQTAEPVSLAPVTGRLSEAVSLSFEEFRKLIRDRKFDKSLRSVATQLFRANADCLKQQKETNRDALVRNARIQCGWFGDHVGDMFTDEFAKVPNRRNLLLKLVLSNKNWYQLSDNQLELRQACDSPGVYAFFHRDIPALKYVGAHSESVFEAVQTLLDDAWNGTLRESQDELLLSCLLCSTADEWLFHFRPCDRRRLHELTLIEMLEHDTLWPAGLNTSMPQTAECRHILRHAISSRQWPPKAVTMAYKASDLNNDQCVGSRGQSAKLTFDNLNAFQYAEMFIQNDLRLFEASETRLQRLFELVSHLKSLTTLGEEDSQVLGEIGKLYREMVDEKASESSSRSSKRAVKREFEGLEDAEAMSDASHFLADLRHQSGWWAGSYRQADTMVFSNATHLDLLTTVLTKKFLETMYEQPAFSFFNLVKNRESDQTDNFIKAALRDDRGGVYWIVHKKFPCLRFVNFTRRRTILDSFRSFINGSFNGDRKYFSAENDEVLGVEAYLASTCLLVTRASEWHFSFYPFFFARHLREGIDNHESLFNEIVVRIDSIWPNGLNKNLLIDENNLASFRESCRSYPLAPPLSI